MTTNVIVHRYRVLFHDATPKSQLCRLKTFNQFLSSVIVIVEGDGERGRRG